MSLLRKIGAAAGIGAAGVTVTLEGDGYSWGEVIRGTVRVEGGSVAQTASEIKLSVEEHWETRDSEGDTDDHYVHHNELILDRQVMLEPGNAREWTFEIAVPSIAEPSHDWSVAARVCVPRAADRHGKRKFDLLLPAPIRGAVAAMLEAVPFPHFGAHVQGNTVELTFRPSKDLKKHLDGVQMKLSLANGEVFGSMEINPQEKSLGDFLRSLAKKDRVRHEVRFNADALAAGASGPAAPEVVNRFRELLKPHLG